MNVGSRKCLSSRRSHLSVVSNCRESTYVIQRFALLQQNDQYYIVRNEPQETNFVHYCMMVYSRRHLNTPVVHLRMEPCSWRNESFLWTLVKTAKTNPFEYYILNEKHRLYLTADGVRVVLSDNFDPFSSAFMWQLFEIQAQEHVPGSLKKTDTSDLLQMALSETTMQTKRTTFRDIEITTLQDLPDRSNDINDKTNSSIEAFFSRGFGRLSTRYAVISKI